MTRLLIALGTLLLAACAEPDRRPDLVLVTLDTVRCDHLGAYGGTGGLSPNLDGLAANGLVHESAFTTMPTTAPAHLSMLTGLHPSEHGSRRNGERLDEGVASREIARRLGSAGYVTAAFVTTPLLARRATGLAGFEIHDSPTGLMRQGRDAVEDALAWLEVETRRPVFLWVHLYDAHSPYGSPEEKRRGLPLDPERHGFVEPGLYEDASLRADMASRYARGVKEADAALGLLIAGLAPLFERPPLLVVTGDHGEALDELLASRSYAYDHGEFLYEEQACVPMVLVGPGVSPGRSRSAVSVRDVYGTLLGAAGLPDPHAPGEGRIDLRGSRAARRIVAVERRRLGARAADDARRHGAAAFDGRRGVIVGEGPAESTGASDAVDPRQQSELTETALRHLPASHEGADPGEPAPAPDPELEPALRALGYLE